MTATGGELGRYNPLVLQRGCSNLRLSNKIKCFRLLHHFVAGRRILWKKRKYRNQKDRQARKYNITLNNPLSMIPPMTHPQIKEEIGRLGSVSYWCMADEIGLKEQTPHTIHLFVQRFAYPLLYGKKRFPQGHIESAYGSSAENKDYILKAGKWKSTSKQKLLSSELLKNMVLCPPKKL